MRQLHWNLTDSLKAVVQPLRCCSALSIVTALSLTVAPQAAQEIVHGIVTGPTGEPGQEAHLTLRAGALRGSTSSASCWR